MKILKVVLYSRNGKKRIINLEDNFTLIIGENNTGKSTIGKIIEYCLGRDEPEIPKGIILEKTEWCGLEIMINAKNVFVARYCLSNGNSSDRAYIKIGTKNVPDKIVQNTNIKVIVTILTREMSIPDNNVLPPTINHNSNKANFKHTLFFCFQNQNEISSKDWIFHRQHEPFIDNTIKKVLPFLLNPITQEQIELDNRKKMFYNDLYKLQAKRELFEYLKNKEYEKAGFLITEILDSGLSSHKPKITEIKKYFYNIINNTDKIKHSGSDTLPALQSEISSLRSELTSKVLELENIERQLLEFKNYKDSLKEQRSRLESTELFDHEEADLCPVCNSHIVSDIVSITALRSRLYELNSKLENETRFQLDLAAHKKKLKKEINSKRSEIIRKSDEIYQIMQTMHPEIIVQSKIKGRVHYWLESQDSLFDTEIQKLSEDESRIRNSLRNIYETELKNNDSEVEQLIDIINQKMMKLIEEMSEYISIEYKDNMIYFDLNSLTISIEKDNRLIKLNRIGSVKNYLIYHILIHLAIHEYSIEHNSHIPSFLILDQPSQAINEEFNNLLAFLSIYIKKHNNNLQLIIFDGKQVSGDLKNHVIQNFDKSNGLIPLDWQT